MSESMIQSIFKTPLVEYWNKYTQIDYNDIIHQGKMYVYHKQACLLAQLKTIILQKDFLFVINHKKSRIKEGTFFITARINVGWSLVLFSEKSKSQYQDNLPFSYKISFMLNNNLAYFYLMRKDNFETWKSKLKKVGIHLNFDEKFIILEKLGQGASASVYKIQNKSTSELFACKIFIKENIQNNQLEIEGLVNEIAILKDIQDHPNLVQLEEIHESDDFIYLVTELIEGEKIYQKKFKFEQHEICQLIESHLSALVFLQRKGIIHRDIKPDNLLLKYSNKKIHNNEIKIIDFGLATYQNSEQYLYQNCGTVGYVAPEILSSKKGDHYSPAADVFSFGVVLYNFLTNSKLFKAKSKGQTFINNKNCLIDFKHPKFITTSPVCILKSTGSNQEDAGR